MTLSESSRLTMHADQEHSGLRIGVLATLIIGFFILFVLIFYLLNEFAQGVLNEYAPGISCLSAMLFALGIAAVAEGFMKRNWHSGRLVTVDEEGISAILGNEKRMKFQWETRINITRWYFLLKGFVKAGREKRVPSNYYCLATQLQQEGERIIVFAFLPPKRAEACLGSSEYVEIKPGDFQDTNLFQRWRGSLERPELPRHILIGEQGPYWLAEQRRWADGLELTSDDFELLMTIVDLRAQE